MMSLTNKRISEIINLLQSKNESGKSIELIAFNMVKRYGKQRTQIIIQRVYPDFNVNEVK